MRRTDREVKDRRELLDILWRADTVRLGLHDQPYPYVVPLSFGMEATEETLAIYIHGAMVGHKHDLIRRDPHVCVEASIFHRYAKTEASATTEFESFIGFGKAELVRGEEAVKGLDLLLAHCAIEPFPYSPQMLEVTSVYKITMDSFTGKRRFV
jgi:nitroimidazol reductase NimA-like FMN-containing flavoprotein (pyridoxamine 5'-phosphate oxidase superfamily)